MDYDNLKWDIGVSTAKYKPCPQSEGMKLSLEKHGLDGAFDCISIGNKFDQVALIPLDSPNAKGNANLILAAPELLEALKRLRQEYLDSLRIIDQDDEVLSQVDKAIDKALKQ